MWAVFKIDKRRELFLSEDIKKKLGQNPIFYKPKMLLQNYKKNKLLSKEFSLLGDYVFCFHPKFNCSSSLSLLSFCRGLKYYLVGSISSQKEIEEFEKLDESILESLSPDHDGDQWYELDLSLWSLSERGVPIYPQARYQLEIAAYISARYDFFDELRVKLQGISDRRTGRRDEKRYFNAKEIQSARTLFWLHPR